MSQETGRDINVVINRKREKVFSKMERQTEKTNSRRRRQTY